MEGKHDYIFLAGLIAGIMIGGVAAYLAGLHDGWELEQKDILETKLACGAVYYHPTTGRIMEKRK